jgi:tRNA-modifying protein YgfZ
MISRKTFFLENRPAAVLKAGGDDVSGFLQGQFTNELRQPPGSAVYGLWLNQKGKILADSHVLRIAEKEFLIISAGTPSAVIQQRLEDYIVADDVTLADETASLHALLAGGPGSGAVIEDLLGARPAAGKFVNSGNLVAISSRALPGENFELIGAAGEIGELKRRLLAKGFGETAPAALEFARISAGIPSVPADLGPGDLPNEGGLDATAISYTKGCYLGQEVMARLKNLGQVRRRLHVVRARGARPAPRSPLYQADKKVGELRSVAAQGDEIVAFAMLSLVNLVPSEGLALGPASPAMFTLVPHG